VVASLRGGAALKIEVDPAPSIFASIAASVPASLATTEPPSLEAEAAGLHSDGTYVLRTTTANAQSVKEGHDRDADASSEGKQL
jgi:hypothetical protein